jgi:hypothetical protein
MAPVHMRAKFWVSERDSAGRAKSAAPAATMAHFITGALGGVLVSYECVWVVWCGCGRDPRRWPEIGHRSVAKGLLQHWKLCAREGVPEVNGLGANGRVPEPLEAGGLRAGCCGGIAAGVLGEVCAEGVEGAEAGAKRHGGLLFYGRTVERERGAMCVWTVR